MIKTFCGELQLSLQLALDNRDCDRINDLMVQLYTDYHKDYLRAIIAYNEECNIKAEDLIKFKILYPKVKFNALFCFTEERVKELCMGIR